MTPQSQFENRKSAIRITLTGPECTGKSTLAQQLLHHFSPKFPTHLTPEFARLYVNQHRHRLSAAPLTADDVPPIAAGQRALQQSIPPSARLILHDTDLLSTAIYARLYHQIDLPLTSEDFAHHYLLCDIDLPWQPDPHQRNESPRRREFFEHFRRTLIDHHLPYTLIRGPHRLPSALQALRPLHTHHGLPT